MFELTPFDRRRGAGKLSRRDPFTDMESFHKNFWNDPWSLWPDDSFGGICTDIRDEGDKFVIEAELPGFDKEDINVDIDQNRLTISAQHSTSREDRDKKGNYIRSERSFGSYSRSFDLAGVKADSVTAAYKNGVLTLELPKTDRDKPKGRRLEIE